MATRPILHLIAGVNGAGKTSLYRYLLAQATPGAEFVNADEIARHRWPGDEAAHVVEAAALAGQRREELLAAGESFVAETVFSHPSKLEFVKRALESGFRVIVYHVHLDSAELAIARVATRVDSGGHDVPSDRVAARYERSLILIPLAAAIADMTLVFDNSGPGTTHRHLMTLKRGRVTDLREPLPDWSERAYASAIADYRTGLP
jgi:predicted ABC-type ATPase